MNPHLEFLLSSVYDGSDLHLDHLADLRKSGLTDETIQSQKIPTVMLSSIFDHLLAFQVPAGVTSMYVIPFFGVHGRVIDHVRVKVFPAITTATGTIKYLQPRRSGVRIYFPVATLDAVLHSHRSLYIVEGEKKSLAVAQLGLPTIGISGIEGWHVSGSRFLHPDLDTVPLDRRVVRIVPDGDLAWNPNTGSLKSTLAALALAHYGPFDRLHLPGARTSTANQLERQAFRLKDTVFVIDDYAPSGLGARELELKAARLLRAVGNNAGRGRLRADLTERPSYPPRGILVATGEQHPTGQSILARTLVLELDRALVNIEALTAAQAMASRLPHVMAGYIAWLGAQMPTLGQSLAEGFTAIRVRAADGAGHLRLPEAIAHLYLGVDLGLAYAVAVGACSGRGGDELRDQAWGSLLEISEAQGNLIETERPSHRFLKVLLTLLVQGKGVLFRRDAGDGDGRPDLLGWQDDEALYLLPEATWYASRRATATT